MDNHRMPGLVHDPAAAKSRRDAPAALRLLHPEMLRHKLFGANS